MIKCILITFLVLIIGCSSKSRVPYLSKKPQKGDKITFSKEGLKPFEISDCGAGIVIIPINPYSEVEKEIPKFCGEKWEIYDLESKESKFMIPLIYGQYCKTVRGLCKKQ